MIRRIALTLGTSVAVLAVAASNAPARDTGKEMSLSTEAGQHATVHVAGNTARRSGYIVASS